MPTMLISFLMKTRTALFIMEEVMPDKSGNGDSESNIQDIMIDMDAYVPEKKTETIKSPDESHIYMNSWGDK